MYVAMYLGYVGRVLQVQLLGELSRGQGDVGYCDDVALMTSASKGNWRMMTASPGNTELWLLV